MQQIVCRLGLLPDPTGGAYMQRSPSSLAVFRGPTSKERGVRERTGGEEETGGEGGSLSLALGRKRKVGAYMYAS